MDHALIGDLEFQAAQRSVAHAEAAVRELPANEFALAAAQIAVARTQLSIAAELRTMRTVHAERELLR